MAQCDTCVSESQAMADLDARCVAEMRAELEVHDAVLPRLLQNTVETMPLLCCLLEGTLPNGWRKYIPYLNDVHQRAS